MPWIMMAGQRCMSQLLRAVWMSSSSWWRTQVQTAHSRTGNFVKVVQDTTFIARHSIYQPTGLIYAVSMITGGVTTHYRRP